MQKASRLTCGAVNYNDALLLQFFIYEFIISHREIESLNALCMILKERLEKRSNKKSRADALQKLLESTRKLSGACYDSMLLLYWNQEHGLLHKLNDYAALFSRSTILEGGRSKRIYHNISQTLYISVQLHDALLAIGHANDKKWREEVSRLFLQVNKLTLHRDRVAKMLPNVIKQYAKDENVIFFILRHSQELDSIFSNGFVKNMLDKMYSNGLTEAKQLLERKYLARGFNQLLPVIASKMENL